MKIPPRKIVLSPYQYRIAELEARKCAMSMSDYIRLYGIPVLTQEQKDMDEAIREVNRIAPGLKPEDL